MTRFVRLAVAGAALLAVSAAHALTINYTFLPGTSLQAQDAIRMAGAAWTSVITTNISVDLNFETGLQMSDGLLGSTRSLNVDLFYSDFSQHLAQASSSAADALAIANLPKGATYNKLINRTSDDPAGAGSATPYISSGYAVRLSSANARAVGFALQTNPSPGCAAACDARIDINSRYQYDYDPSDGISAGSYDFVGIVRHEIGHALGFFSAVDYLDAASAVRPASQYNILNSLDLFRYSTLSAASHVVDFTADSRPKYFSLDGGATMGPEFSEGEYYGDGAQASHWKEGAGIGVMGPSVVEGAAVSGITSADLMAMDAIGWSVSAVPEPMPASLFAVGLAVLGWRRRSRQMRRSVAGD